MNKPGCLISRKVPQAIPHFTAATPLYKSDGSSHRSRVGVAFYLEEKFF